MHRQRQDAQLSSTFLQVIFLLAGWKSEWEASGASILITCEDVTGERIVNNTNQVKNQADAEVL